MSRLQSDIRGGSVDRAGMREFMDRSADTGQRSVQAVMERRRMQEAQALAAMREGGMTQRQGMGDANRLATGAQQIRGQQALQGQRLGAEAQEAGRNRQFQARMQRDQAIINELMEDANFKRKLKEMAEAAGISEEAAKEEFLRAFVENEQLQSQAMEFQAAGQQNAMALGQQEIGANQQTAARFADVQRQTAASLAESQRQTAGSLAEVQSQAAQRSQQYGQETMASKAIVDQERDQRLNEQKMREQGQYHDLATRRLGTSQKYALGIEDIRERSGQRLEEQRSQSQLDYLEAQGEQARGVKREALDEGKWQQHIGDMEYTLGNADVNTDQPPNEADKHALQTILDRSKSLAFESHTAPGLQAARRRLIQEASQLGTLRPGQKLTQPSPIYKNATTGQPLIMRWDSDDRRFYHQAGDSAEYPPGSGNFIYFGPKGEINVKDMQPSLEDKVSYSESIMRAKILEENRKKEEATEKADDKSLLNRIRARADALLPEGHGTYAETLDVAIKQIKEEDKTLRDAIAAATGSRGGGDGGIDTATGMNPPPGPGGRAGYNVDRTSADMVRDANRPRRGRPIGEGTYTDGSGRLRGRPDQLTEEVPAVPDNIKFTEDIDPEQMKQFMSAAKLEPRDRSQVKKGGVYKIKRKGRVFLVKWDGEKYLPLKELTNDSVHSRGFMGFSGPENRPKGYGSGPEMPMPAAGGPGRMY